MDGIAAMSICGRLPLRPRLKFLRPCTGRLVLFKPVPTQLQSRLFTHNESRGQKDKSASLKLTYPDPPTTQHSDLDSFLAYAKRSGLDEKSTVYVGTHFEYKVSRALSKYGFHLKRIGGASDYGTDLVGTWSLPFSSFAALRVIVQCKAGSQRVSPQHVRELEGAFVGAPPGWRGQDVLGLLVSEQTATKGVRYSLGRSRWPMMYINCTGDGKLTQMLWNQRAEEVGLDGYGVSVRHAGGKSGGTAELVMVYNGKILPLREEP